MAFLVNVRHRTDAGGVEIAAYQLNADGSTGLEVAHIGSVTGAGRTAAAGYRQESEGTEFVVHPVDDAGAEAAERERREQRLGGGVAGSLSGRSGGGCRFGFAVDFGEHVMDGGDAGNRVVFKGPAVGEGADEFAVDVNGTATHAGDNFVVFEVGAAHFDEDHVLFGHGVFEDADDFDFEALGFCAVEDGEAVAFHAGLELVGAESFLRRGGEGRQTAKDEKADCSHGTLCISPSAPVSNLKFPDASGGDFV